MTALWIWNRVRGEEGRGGRAQNGDPHLEFEEDSAARDSVEHEASCGPMLARAELARRSFPQIDASQNFYEKH